MEVATGPLATLKSTAVSGRTRADNSRFWDSVYHNWGIVVAIALGAIGTGLPADYPVYSKICTGLATAIFAVERSLDFGSRWRFHRRVGNGYRKVEARIELAMAFTDPAAREIAIKDIMKVMDSVLDMDCEIPGVGGDQRTQNES